MDFETASRIYRDIKGSALLAPKRNLFNLAVRYARLRTDWRLVERDQRREMDGSRRVAHDAFIDACNMLSRKMLEAGEDNQWRDSMTDRIEIGDLACYIHCFLGLEGR